MHPIVAHHAGEDTLLNLLLLGGGGLSVMLYEGRTRLAAILEWFARPARRR
jgi:hypothetical protein